jgi:hypothetical protein
LSATFPDPAWFHAVGRLMEAESEAFRRLGYVDARLVIRVVPDEPGGRERATGLVFEGYGLADARALGDPATFDPDFTVCARASVWARMLGEIARGGRPELRHTLSSLALLGEELWLESTDQLREDKFYRFNQTLQEFFNLAARLASASRA